MQEIQDRHDLPDVGGFSFVQHFLLQLRCLYYQFDKVLLGIS